MVRRLIVGVALASSAALSVAGCGSDEPKEAPEVAWAGKACGVLNQGKTLAVPKIDAVDVVQSKQNLVTMLDDISARLKTLSMDMQGLGAPPVPGGQAVHATAMGRLTSTSSAVTTASRQLRKAKVTDAKSLQRAIKRVGAAFAAYSGYQGPQQDLRANPALNSAFAKAPGCQAEKTS
ncbi:hypothetical protein [Actinomadura sp. 9N407]|uniref:hypothetical protein n=1 Tax=Actinomadura sp. 9N407 TaxID=3375154 RepID=UPI0037A58ECC